MATNRPMTKLLVVTVGLGLALAACASDEGGGGVGNGGDTLPKRGEMATDPTIVSATARCSCGGEVCSGGDPQNGYVSVRVDGTDPKGQGNLATCAGTLAAVSDQGTYGEGNACSLYFKVATPCAVGSSVTVGLTVANDSGGVTTASVKLAISQ